MGSGGKESIGGRCGQTAAAAPRFPPARAATTHRLRLPLLPPRCAQAGVTKLFAYDPTGFLKQAAPELRAHLARAVSLHVGWDGPAVVATVEDGAAAPRPVLGAVNGELRRRGAAGGKGRAPPAQPPPPAGRPPLPPTAVVRLLSARDAEAPLLAAAAAVSRSASPSPASSPGAPPPPPPPTLTPAHLDGALREAAGDAALAEPDVVLVYGRTFTLAGYPPWPLRHSEIYSMGRLTRASAAGVRGALARFGATAQRFGR